MIYSIYSLNTGVIRCIFTGPEHAVAPNLLPGEGYSSIIGRPGIDKIVDGELVIMPIPTAVLADRARAERNRLLMLSDWTQMPDVPLATKQAWADYRQALRDITGQPGYPLEITWPTPPGAQS